MNDAQSGAPYNSGANVNSSMRPPGGKEWATSTTRVGWWEGPFCASDVALNGWSCKREFSQPEQEALFSVARKTSATGPSKFAAAPKRRRTAAPKGGRGQ